MQPYFGTKMITAIPMTRQAYNDARGWTLPEDENGSDKGYLIEDALSSEGLKQGPPGHISWVPTGLFHATYRASGALSFGHALEALKAGYRVARTGWNGKDMWLSISCPENRPVPANGFWSPQNRAWAHENGGWANVLPSITMKTAEGSILMGWLASQTDMLAEDWVVLE